MRRRCGGRLADDRRGGHLGRRVLRDLRRGLLRHAEPEGGESRTSSAVARHAKHVGAVAGTGRPGRPRDMDSRFEEP